MSLAIHCVNHWRHQVRVTGARDPCRACSCTCTLMWPFLFTYICSGQRSAGREHHASSSPNHRFTVTQMSVISASFSEHARRAPSWLKILVSPLPSTPHGVGDPVGSLLTCLILNKTRMIWLPCGEDIATMR